MFKPHHLRQLRLPIKHHIKRLNMITLSELVEMMPDITHDSVDEKFDYLWEQRANRLTDLLIIGHADDFGATATAHYVNRSTVTVESAALQRLVAQMPQSPEAVCRMTAASKDIEKLIDYMYTGIYGQDALEHGWREMKGPSLLTNVRMYTMAIIFEMPLLERFVLDVIERTYRIAFRHDQILAIYNAWMTPENNWELQACLLACEFDAMKTAQSNIDDWLRQTERKYRHEEFEAQLRRLAEDWIYGV